MDKIENKKIQQIEFSSVLFDALFGLVVFFSIDSFMDIKNPLHFVFYLFSLIIVIHWWLVFKTADDAFDNEVSDSGLDLVIGIIELVLIEYIVLTARSFDYIAAGWFLIALFSVDMLWTLVWRYIGEWKITNLQHVKNMERELKSNLIITSVGLGMFILLLILSQFISSIIYIFGFIIFYVIYIIFSFRYKIIDIKIF